ncbi:taurine ABC transporter substrate-binding protein [Aurantimonas sp. A3-2-R12]|uniref:taurine ABC transporter substrate-binding protein n=1 Tax=Aurantimonas sp. A3-2-R12 TaxID=3114362 RepID=UPI002E190CE6|nr:ABC transporter substrate-binding protein [Aurantimonas sp. A3-2-R12]
MTSLTRISTGLAAAAAFALTTSIAVAQPSEITVAYFLEWPTANQIAQVDGTYEKELGVTVNWRAFGNGNEMSQAMASGDVQIAFSQGLVPFVVAVSNGLPLKTVGIAVSYAEADNCVVHDDAGITKDNAEDLEGKKIATPIGNVTHYKLLRMLDHLGVDATKVDLVQMNGADAAIALGRGDVAMGCAFGGPLQRMKEYGKVLMTAAEQEEIGIRVFDVISVTKEFAEESPDLLRKFMAVTSKANEAYAAGPEKYQTIIAKASGMDLPAATEMLGMFSFPTSAEQASDNWLGGSVQKFTKEVADFFVAQGEMDKALDDYSGMIDPSFLQ